MYINAKKFQYTSIYFFWGTFTINNVQPRATSAKTSKICTFAKKIFYLSFKVLQKIASSKNFFVLVVVSILNIYQSNRKP